MTVRAEQLKVQLAGLEQQPPAENRLRRIDEIKAEIAKENTAAEPAPTPDDAVEVETASMEPDEKAVQPKAPRRKPKSTLES